MREGFRLLLTGKEIKAHLEDRARWHGARADWYEQQKEQLATAPTAQMTNDPVQGLKEAGKRHRESALKFQFYAEHTAVEESYMLDDGELHRLEMLSLRGY